MANRILKAEGLVPDSEVAHKLEAFTPREGKEYELLEVWTDGTDGIEVSMSIDERTIIERVPAANLATVDNRLVFDLIVEAGVELNVLATETSGADQEFELYMLIDEHDA